nr:MAG TPA: hypothetical protein [Bacteriophage sp.]
MAEKCLYSNRTALVKTQDLVYEIMLLESMPIR